MKAIKFNITKELMGCQARAGVIETPHGHINTPAFIVGGTKATVKALTPEQIKDLGGEAVLVNTYHLMLRPGAEIIKYAGGLNKFMNWDGPTFSDSGGFQVFSLGVAYKKGIEGVSNSQKGDKNKACHTKNQLAKITDSGVEFRSHLDGQKIFMSPRISMQLQHEVGADIHFAFDECNAALADRKYMGESLNRTHKWAVRCLDVHKNLNSQHQKNSENLQALFAVIQGGRNEDLRRSSAKYLSNLDFDGYGIGSVYEPEEISETVRWVVEELPKDNPRHLLGMGSQPADLFLGIEYGIDTFDCVAPTRQARNGSIYTKNGRINIRNAKFTKDFTSIEPNCTCYACKNFTKAYINHLFRSDEILGATLASIHNEYFVVNTVKKIRQSILDDIFYDFKREFLANYYRKEAKKYL